MAERAHLSGTPAGAGLAPPEVGPAGRRTAEEIAALHRHRVDKAIAWFREAAEGRTPRLCPVCGHEGLFSPVRHKVETWCPSCDSRPRHRLLRLWLDREARLGPGARVIHFAAEPWARDWFAARGAIYRTADINDRFDLRLDITAMELPDASAEMILANHVLEHVDDRAALAEIHRVLAPGGRAVLTVPMIEGWDETHEDPEIADAEARRLHYGDPTHLRFYGRDVRARITRAGFRLSEFAATEPDVSTHALQRGERLFIAEKL